jgi:hypothetical protein
VRRHQHMTPICFRDRLPDRTAASTGLLHLVVAGKDQRRAGTITGPASVREVLHTTPAGWLVALRAATRGRADCAGADSRQGTGMQRVGPARRQHHSGWLT